MDPMTALTAISLAVASVAGLTGALVSWQTYLNMKDIKKKLAEQRRTQAVTRYGVPVWPGPNSGERDDYPE